MAINLPDKNSRTPLLYAAAHGREVVVKLLLSRDDVAVNSRNRSGPTPLSLAARYGHEAVVQLLKQHMRQLGERRTEDVTDE